MHRYATLLLFAAMAAAQQPTTPTLTPKSSPAAESLAQMAKDQTEDQKHLNDIFQQARHNLDANQKALNDELAKTQQALEAKLKADKHYKDDLEHIDGLKKQIQDGSSKAQNDFMKSVGPIQQKLQTESVQVQGLIPVVRKENGWPDTATFATDTQKWTDAAKPAPVAEKK
jgi:predicted RNase H-like nuclease (RuvC/YqgF family)